MAGAKFCCRFRQYATKILKFFASASMQCMSDRYDQLKGDLDAARLQSVRAEPGIFSQIVICLFLHADICDILSFSTYVNPVIWRI